MRFWRKQELDTWCQGCGTEWPVCAMNWDTIGQYRCRICNPDPGAPHDAQTPAQRVRSQRYAAARAGTAKRYRCTECGRRIRKHGWNFCAPWATGKHRETAEALAPLFTNVELCDDCVGPDPHTHGWMGFDLVRHV